MYSRIFDGDIPFYKHPLFIPSFSFSGGMHAIGGRRSHRLGGGYGVEGTVTRTKTFGVNLIRGIGVGGFAPTPDWFSKQAGWNGVDGTKETDAALLDGTPGTYKWDEYMCSVPSTHCIFAADGATWLGGSPPTGITNVLRVHYYTSPSICGLVRTALPMPAVGQYLFIRSLYYDTRDHSGYGGSQPHPFQDTNNNWFLLMEDPGGNPDGSGRGNGTNGPLCFENNAASVYEKSRYYVYLTTGTLWYVVMRWFRQSTSVWIPRMQIYNAAGAASRTPTYTSADFYDRIGRSGAFAMDGATGVESFPMASTPHLEVGTNGTDNTREFDYIFGAFAAKVSDDPNDWLVPISVAEGGPGSVPLDWFSDWRFGTGTGDNAIFDGANSGAWKWNTGNSGGGDVNTLSVVAASGLGFPFGMTNCLRVNFSASPFMSKMVRVVNAWSLPAVGESVYHRVYFRNDVADGLNIGVAHSLQAGMNPGWDWCIDSPGGTVDQGFNANTILMQIIGNFNTYPNNKFTAGGWSHGSAASFAVWRLEWQIFRNATNTAKFTVRIYNSSDVLIYTSSQMYGDLGVNLGTANPDWPLNDLGGGANPDAQLRQINLGNNGPGTQPSGNNYQYWGGYAVSRTDWCGPWNSIRG